MSDILFLILIFLALFAANVACVHYVRWLDDKRRRMPEIFKRWVP